MLTIALSMVVLVFAANFIVDQYVRGVMRNAVDEGARAGAVQGAAPDACQTRINQVLANLVNGGIGTNITTSCTAQAGVVDAAAHATLPGWLPVVPAWTFTVHGASRLEQNPT